MQSEQPSSAEQPAMQCSQCDTILCQSEQCSFYNKTPTEVHLILRPELRNMPSSMFLSNICETGTADVKCSACKCNIGRRLPFRPEGKNFVAFGNEKVYVFGNRLHNFIYMFGSQIATSTSSHSAPSPPGGLRKEPGFGSGPRRTKKAKRQ